jgi:hypothetical protein
MINPQALAAFVISPDASRIMEAFSKIKPGFVRDSLILHIETMAGNVPTQAAEPKAEAARPAPTIQSTVKSPVRRNSPKTADELQAIRAEAIRLRMQGVGPALIAKHFKVNPSTISNTVYLARKNGTKFPDVIIQDRIPAKILRKPEEVITF